VHSLSLVILSILNYLISIKLDKQFFFFLSSFLSGITKLVHFISNAYIYKISKSCRTLFTWRCRLNAVLGMFYQSKSLNRFYMFCISLYICILPSFNHRKKQDRWLCFAIAKYRAPSRRLPPLPELLRTGVSP
jgi:hypothetical protein